MPMKAYIICDASYDPVLEINVIAGAFVVDGKAERFTMRSAGIKNSNEGEMTAIFESIKRLNTRINERGLLEKVTDLHICTDSLTSQTKIIKSKKGLYKKIKDLDDLAIGIKGLSSGYDSVRIHKVKAHVHPSKANHIETLHNEVDKMAYIELKAFRRELLSPDVYNSKHYGVSLCSDFKPYEKKDMFKSAYDLASSGFKARIYMDDKNLEPKDFKKHPFLKGIAFYAKEKGLSIESLYTEVFSNKNVKEKNDNLYGTRGLDKTLLNKSLNNDEVLKVFSHNSPSGLIAGACTRLIFGNQDPVRQKTKEPFKRSQKPSRFLINFAKNGSTYRWSSTFSDMVKMPYFKKAKQVARFISAMNKTCEINTPIKSVEVKKDDESRMSA